MLTPKRFDIILSRIEKSQNIVSTHNGNVETKERKVKEVKVDKPRIEITITKETFKD